MNSPLSDLGNMMVVWDSDDLAGAFDPDEDDGQPTRGSGEVAATRGVAHRHVLDNGICTTCTPPAQRAFNPSEPRIPGGEHGGEWGHGGAGAAVKDALKLAGRIQLNDGETFKGSTKMDGHAGTIGLAWTERGGQRHLRLGMLGEHDSDWHAADDGSSAALDEHGIEALKTSLRDMRTKGVQAVKDFKDVIREMDAIESKHGADESKWAPAVTAQYGELVDEYRRLFGDAAPVHGNTIYGSDFGQIRVGVAANEGTPSEYDMWLVPQRRGAEEPGHLALAAQDGDGLSLTKAQLAKLLKLLDGPSEAGAAARSFSPNERVGHPHVLRNGICTTCEVQRRFDPSEPRIPGGPHGGEWGHGGSAGKALKDALKLDGKIDLGPDEKLVGSDKLLADSGSIRMALTETHGQKSLRLGLGDSAFGSREDEAGPWRGSDKVAELNAERKKLDDEHDSVVAELDNLDAEPNADPARKAALQKRLDQLDEMDTSHVAASGYTATIDEAGMQQLHAALTDGLAKGVAHDKRVNGGYNRVEELDKQLGDINKMPRDAWTPALRDQHAKQLAERQALQKELDAEGWTIFAEGSVPGKEADVHYRVDFDDPSQGVGVQLAAVPHDSGLTFEDLASEAIDARLDEAETKKFLRQLQSFAVAPIG